MRQPLKAAALKAILTGRLSEYDVRAIVAASGCNVLFADKIYSFVFDCDERLAFNALRVLVHFSPDNLLSFGDRSNELVDCLLSETHEGKKRLILSLLYKLPVSEAYSRVDFMDYCFAGINSLNQYAIRALCMKHCLAFCARYPDFKSELSSAIELMKLGDIPPSLSAVCRSIGRSL